MTETSMPWHSLEDLAGKNEHCFTALGCPVWRPRRRSKWDIVSCYVWRGLSHRVVIPGASVPRNTEPNKSRRIRDHVGEQTLTLVFLFCFVFLIVTLTRSDARHLPTLPLLEYLCLLSSPNAVCVDTFGLSDPDTTRVCVRAVKHVRQA